MFLFCRWGVPPEVDLLSAAIQQGGGIVDKVYKQWGMFPGLVPVYNMYNNTPFYGPGSSSSSSSSSGPFPYGGSTRGSSC
jgi:hypothetical protein